jgi:plasmid maintenance system antidote protein VapI
MARKLQETHPGEILLEDFMRPMGISARQLASDIDVQAVHDMRVADREFRPKIAKRVQLLETQSA